MKNLQLQVMFSALDKISAPFKQMSRSVSSARDQFRQAREQLKELNKQAGQIAGYQATQKNLSVTTNELEKARARVKALAVEMTNSENPTKKMVRQFEQAQQVAITLSQKKKSLTEQIKRERDQLKSAGIDTRALKQHQEQLAKSIDNTTGALEQNRKKLDQVAAKQRKMAEARSAFDKTNAMRNNMAGTGAGLVATGVGMGALAMKPVQEFKDAETAATELKVSMMQAGGAVRKEFGEINDLATKLGNKLPGTTADFQRMMSTLIQQGMSAKSILGGLGEATAYLGVQMKLPFDEAAKFAAKMQDATRTAEKDMMALMDVIQRSYYLGVDQDNMLQAFTKLSPALPILRKDGLDAAKLLAPLIVMADQAGMAGEASGNAYRKAFQLSMNPEKVAKANKLMEASGVKLQFSDGKGEFGGIEQMFAQLGQMKKLNTETRLAALKEIFGDDSETLQVLTLLIDKGQAGYNETMAKMKAQASLQLRVNEQLGTLGALWDSATGTFTNAMVLFGEAIAPEIKALTKWIADVSEKLGGWAKRNPELSKTLMKIVFVAAAVTTVLGFLALGAAAVLGPFALLKMAMSVLGLTMMATPIGWILGGLAALAAAAAFVISNWDNFPRWWDSLWGGASALFNKYWGYLKLAFEWSPLGVVGKTFGELFDWFMSLEGRFDGIGGRMIDALISGIRNKLNDLKAAFSELAESGLSTFKDIFGIASPSKVMATMGDETVNGLILGIGRSSPAAQKAMSNHANRLNGVALLTASPAAQPGAKSSAGKRQASVQIEIHAPMTVTAPPGIDAEQLRLMIRDENNRNNKAMAAQVRSRLQDLS